MALIKCPECGNMISDKALRCPQCGAPKMEQSQNQPFQQEVVPPNEQRQSMQNQYPYYYDEDESNTNKRLYGIIALLVLALLAVGYWAWNSGLLGNHNGKEAVSEMEKDSTMVASDSATLDGTQNFSGSIGPANVEMSIFIDGSDVNGYYHYNSQERGHNMTLQGNMGSGGVITLTEYSPEGFNSGRLEGVFNGTTLEGSLVNMINGKQHKVNLSKANSLLKLTPVTKATSTEITSNLTLLKEKKSEKPPFTTDCFQGRIGIDIYENYCWCNIYIEDDEVRLEYDTDENTESARGYYYDYNYIMVFESYDSQSKNLVYNVFDLKGRYFGKMVGKLGKSSPYDTYEGVFLFKDGQKRFFDFITCNDEG